MIIKNNIFLIKMKSLTMLVIFLFLFEQFSSKSMLAVHSTLKGDTIGVVYNTEDKANREAKTFSKAKFKSEIKKEIKYKSPSYVSDVDKERTKAIPPSPLETVDEIKTDQIYYDKSNELNVIEINCTIFENKEDCVKQVSCGWCGTGSRCIKGNRVKPFDACPIDDYIFE